MLEPRLLLTAGDVVDGLQGPLEEVASPLETGPIAHPLAVAASEEANPLVGSATPGGFAPDQIRHAYGFDQVFFDGGSIVGDGTGQTIAIVNAFHTPTAAADLAAFNAHFGLPAAPSFVQVDQSGGTSFPGSDSGWALETALDVQWAHAFAPGADILLVEADSAAFGDLMVAVDYARSQPDVSIVSMSWGTTGEFSTETNFDFHFTTPAGHDGVTFFAAAGNSGGPGGYPAYSGNVVAVGGTTLTLDASNNIASEVAWSDSGGGISQFEPQPFWQNGVVTQTTTQRAMPDVAFNANPSTGVPVYDTFNNSVSTPWTKVAGTSFATPSWASLVAVANQGRELEGLPVFDMTELMTTLYAMPADNFNDITSGSSGGSIPQSAGPGYDLVTGLGTPKAQKVVASLVGEASVSGTVFNDTNGNGTLDGESGLVGWTVYADLNTNGLFDAAAVDNFNSADVPLGISTFGTSTITSDNLVSGLTGNIIDVDVTLDINHTRTSDLTITLVAPGGTEIVLANQVGGTGDNFAGTTFDDSAVIPIASGTAPFNGSFQPTGSLATLVGADPNGTWQLRIQDSGFFDGGSLNSWSLEITTGEPSTLSEADGTFQLEGLSDGTYQIRQVLQSPYVQTAPAGGFYTVVLADGQGATARDFGNQLPQSDAPSSVALTPASDSGISSSDAITKLNNSAPGAVLQFEVAGTIAGATVTLLADGTPIGSAIASGSTTIVSTDGATTLADGIRSITARQTVPSQPTSSDSPALAVTIDTTAPISSITPVAPDPRSTPVDEMTISFNEAVSGLDLNGLLLVRDSGSDLLSGAQTVDTVDGFTWTLHNLTGLTAAPGFYELFLSAALSPAVDAAGNIASDASSNFTVASATVTGRHIFYNDSTYDAASPGIDPADGAAIATDKTAYLPGDGIITPASMTSYARGINGLFVDLTGPHAALSLADFEFKVSDQGSGAAGANNTPSSWSAAPVPIAFTVLSDAPAAGTDRVAFIWADGAIENRYLEITVRGNDAAGGFNTNTALAASDIFYFGNIVGDTFNDASPTAFLTTAADETEIQTQIISTATITSIHDMDRNGVHLASDRIVVRDNTITALNRIDVGNPPAAPAQSGGDDDGAAAAVAFGLSAPATTPSTLNRLTVEVAEPSTPASRADATPRRQFDPGIAFALAARHQRLANAAGGDWLDPVDESLVDLLGRLRFARRQ